MYNKDRAKQYRERNREKQRQYEKNWKIKNKDKVKERDKKYRENNKEKFIEISRKSRNKNKTKINEKGKEYYKKNIIKIKIIRFLNRKLKPPKRINLSINNYKVKRIIQKKIYAFLLRGNTNMNIGFTEDDLFNKIKENPKCYLTGRDIDVSKPSQWSLDHIIPVSKGGVNSLENCGITCKEANHAKNNLLLNEFIKLCHDVVKQYPTCPTT